MNIANNNNNNNKIYPPEEKSFHSSTRSLNKDNKLIRKAGGFWKNPDFINGEQQSLVCIPDRTISKNIQISQQDGKKRKKKK